jgi:hypothetical protein
MWENLQVMVLKMLSDRGVFKNICFAGGTALRMVHGLNRFSEDLDFSISSKKGFDFERIIKGVRLDLERNNIGHTVKMGGENAVKSAFLKFHGLLHGAGISPLKAENLSVR